MADDFETMLINNVMNYFFLKKNDYGKAKKLNFLLWAKLSEPVINYIFTYYICCNRLFCKKIKKTLPLLMI